MERARRKIRSFHDVGSRRLPSDRGVKTIKKKPPSRQAGRSSPLLLRAYENFIYELLYNIPGMLDSDGVYCLAPQPRSWARARASLQASTPLPLSQSASFSPSKRVKGIPAGGISWPVYPPRRKTHITPWIFCDLGSASKTGADARTRKNSWNGV